mmetsp:Transcript_33796/g.110499  ORF Transcript_33796/g.110499 Transcript_33796/m.110499 type:complete len:392 (+) Transcript_33796:1734-2909(+)
MSQMMWVLPSMGLSLVWLSSGYSMRNFAMILCFWFFPNLTAPSRALMECERQKIRHQQQEQVTATTTAITPDDAVEMPSSDSSVKPLGIVVVVDVVVVDVVVVEVVLESVDVVVVDFVVVDVVVVEAVLEVVDVVEEVVLIVVTVVLVEMLGSLKVKVLLGSSKVAAETKSLPNSANSFAKGDVLFEGSGLAASAAATAADASAKVMLTDARKFVVSCVLMVRAEILDALASMNRIVMLYASETKPPDCRTRWLAPCKCLSNKISWMPTYFFSMPRTDCAMALLKGSESSSGNSCHASNIPSGSETNIEDRPLNTTTSKTVEVDVVVTVVVVFVVVAVVLVVVKVAVVAVLVVDEVLTSGPGVKPNESTPAMSDKDSPGPSPFKPVLLSVV